MGDRNAFHDRYIELLQAMMADVRDRCIHFPVASDLSYISTRVENEGEKFVFASLPLLGKALDKALATGDFECPPVFKRRKGSALPLLYNGGFSAIFTDEGKLRPFVSPITVQALRQLTLFDSKALRPFSPLEISVFEGAYRMQQRSLRSLRVPVGDPILEICKNIIYVCLRNFNVDPLHLPCKHGPGATADRKNFVTKWEFDEWPQKLERHFPFLQYGCVNIHAAMRRKKAVRLTRKCVTRACFVPKDFRGPRLISIEPAAMQYVQQGMCTLLMEHVKNGPLRNRISFTDQTVNQKRAQRAVFNADATVDLSSASDTLSAVVVWEMFSRLPILRRLLFHLRSDAVGFPHGDERLVSFSPMGSAICFPIETFCFYALAVASVMRDQNIGYHRASRLVSVYGDDIVLPISSVDTLNSILTRIGCKLNTSKTCYKTPFRESCGKEFYDGEDVTICRYKYFSYNNISIDHHPALRSLQRNFFSKGYYRTAEMLLQWANKIYPTAVTPCGTNRDEDLYCFGTYHYVPLPYRYDNDLQIHKFSVPVYSPSIRVWNESKDELGLMAALVSNSYSSRFAIRGRLAVKIAWRCADGLEIVRR